MKIFRNRPEKQDLKALRELEEKSSKNERRAMAMFYVKEQLSDTAEIRIDITDENVYGSCPVCGREVEVNLHELFVSEDVDLYSTQVLCESCSKLIVRKGDKKCS